MIQRYYIECQTEKETLHIKIKAESEEEAVSKIHEMYKVKKIVEVKTKQPFVKYEKAADGFSRDMYPYIKNDNGKAIRIFS